MVAAMEGDLIFGLNAVLTALQRNPQQIEAVWLSQERNDRRVVQLAAAARTAGLNLQRLTRAELDLLAGSEHHQGAVARLRPSPARDERELAPFLGQLDQPPLLLVLDGVQDPRNLGACLRCADAAGAHAVLIPRDRAAAVTASVRHVASGAAESLPVFRVTNLSRALRLLKSAGLWLVGAVPSAQTSLFEADLRGPLALVVGGEGHGLRRLTREHCDSLVRIPMHGSVPSLNVSVAAAICLYEILRQRQAG